MVDPPEEAESGRLWTWVAVAAGAALGVLVVIYLSQQRDPSYRMDRVLRRCEERIRDIESSLLDLQIASSPPEP